MNLSSFVVVALIIGLVLFFVVRSFRSFKAGENKCSGCTVTTCPLSSYAVKSQETNEAIVCCEKDRK